MEQGDGMTRRCATNGKTALTAALAAAAGLASAEAVAVAAAAERLMDCSDQEVQYDTIPREEMAEHISIKPLLQRPRRWPDDPDPEYISGSPQGTAAYNRVVVADTTKPGPRSNVIEVFSTKGAPVAWRIEVVDLRDNARLRWLNEDLLFIQAWRGRVVSTDLIFELRSGQFVYAREAHYGMLVQPCEERGEPAKAD
jgi:hypothetical protein